MRSMPFPPFFSPPPPPPYNVALKLPKAHLTRPLFQKQGEIAPQTASCSRRSKLVLPFKNYKQVSHVGSGTEVSLQLRRLGLFMYIIYRSKKNKLVPVGST